MSPARRDLFVRAALESDGFVGWSPVVEPDLERTATDRRDVYIVYRPAAADAEFRRSSRARRIRGEASVPAAMLRAKWVPGAHVLFIGGADPRHRRRGPRHQSWGERLLWHLTDSADLLVAWAAWDGEAPKPPEATLLTAFRSAFGRAPFANDDVAAAGP